MDANKRNVFKKILDKRKTIKELAAQINIESYVNGMASFREGDKVTYGVNVRLSKDFDNNILPFSYSKPHFDSNAVANNIPDGFKILDFLTAFTIKEATFKVNFFSNNDEITITRIQQVFGDEWYTLNPFIDSAKNGAPMEERFKTEFFDKSNHTFLHENIKKLKLEPGWVYVWVCGEDPDVSTNSDGSYLTNILAISDYEDGLKKFIEENRAEIIEFVMLLKSRRTDDSDIRQKKEAVKSAKAAIMSRNMSHNLGSHVMSYLKHHLGSVKDMLNDKILSQLFESEQDLTSLLQMANSQLKIQENSDTGINLRQKDVDKIALPFLVGLGQFISYLQERQDFIATIATDYIPYYSTVNFKDFIYDELNNDKRYERHPDRQNLKPDNILLGNIARSEGLGRTTCPTSVDNGTTLCDIVLKFRTTFTGDPVEKISASPSTPGVIPTDYYHDKTLVQKAKEELNEMRNYDVSLPGGIVGRQAIFSIFENVIRNAAKHGNWRDKGKLELTIDIFSKEDVLNENPDADLKERFIDDSPDEGSLSLKEVLKRYYCGSSNKADNELYFVTLTDNLSFTKESLYSLRKAIIEDYIDDESGKMKNANKGIKEMRISSAWLRSIDDNPSYSPVNLNNYDKGDKTWLQNGECWKSYPPVLYARRSKGKDGECHLQYVFCLVRPQKVAFVSSDFENNEERINNIIQKESWKVFSPSSFIAYNNKSFEFVVYDDNLCQEANEEEYKMVRHFSSTRFFKLSELEESNFAKIKQLLLQESTCYNDTLGGLLKGTITLLYRKLSKWDKAEMIYIYDEKAYEGYKDADKTDIVDKITFEKSEEKAKYRYVTHLEDKKEFEEHVINNATDRNKFIFSEGITGNNSTDRLIRNEPLTELWFYKQLFAIKQKIGIFDERIFSKAFGVEETDFTIHKIEGYGNDIKSDKEKLIANFPQYSTINQCDSYEMLDPILQALKINPRQDRDVDLVEARTHLGATYASKNLYIFSIIRSCENTDSFNLYGFSLDLATSTFSQCKKYAKFSWNKEAQSLEVTPVSLDDAHVLSSFDNLSIHQGLLDKLYGAFNIKGDQQAKENLTRDFYSKFANADNIIAYEGNDIRVKTHYFLPGMTIHSGRSKPSESDMPQQLPFIPYSAIEHAVLDCKYSLVELLNSARYE